MARRKHYLSLREVRRRIAKGFEDQEVREVLCERLTLYAEWRMQRMVWHGEYNGVPPGGAEPEDLVQEAVFALWEGENRHWRVGDDLLKALTQVISSMVSNLANGSENTSTRRIQTVRENGHLAFYGISEGVLTCTPPVSAEELELLEELARIVDPVAYEVACYFLFAPYASIADAARDLSLSPPSRAYRAVQRLREALQNCTISHPRATSIEEA